ncbi:hypothetical protein HK405_007583 [Cladochytrium tenue]|nr:hypothetical protein HK405_007583 [Cladochytrium tenue]
MVKKRPGGLAASASSTAALTKRTRSSHNDGNSSTNDAATQGKGSAAEEPTDTVAVAVTGDGSDELGELKELFESALDKLENEEEDGASLLRAVIHESDRILRMYHEDAKQGPDAGGDGGIPTALMPDFHYIYASALFRLGMVAAEEAAEGDQTSVYVEHLNAAVDRYERGLELLKKAPSKGAEWKFSEAIGRTLLEKV